jgi:hypothetical protein
MQPNEFARTREREKVRRRSLRKVDAVIGKGVPGGGFDIDHVVILLQWSGLIFIPWAPLDSCSRKSSKLPN